MRRFNAVAACLALVVSAGACGGEPAGPADPPERLDVSVLRFSEADAELASTPADAMKASYSEVVVDGRVEGFSQGREITTPGGTVLHRVVMRVAVTEKIKGPSEATRGEKVYVELWGGRERGVDEVSAGIPAGTRVVVFGGGVLMGGGGDVGRGHPEGTRLLSGNHPQSLVFENPAKSAGETTGLVGGLMDIEEFGSRWAGVASMDELVDELKKARE